MKIVVLDAATLGEDINILELEKLGDTVVYNLTPPEQVAQRLEDCRVCIVNKVRLNEMVLKDAKKLKLICVAATGYDNIDTEYCRKAGIALCNVAGYSVNSVSQLTLAMVLSASVNLQEYKESVVNGNYTKGGVQNILTPVYHELWGKVWGIVGYGAIGKRVGAAAKAIGCRVIVNKRTSVEGEECVSLEELVRASDIISIHTPLTEETRNLIGEKEIGLMKDGVFLVNVARGAVTDEAAIAKAVKSGKIGFFGCDVYSAEPMAEEHPFYSIRNMKNVCLTPHMAWGAYESRMRCIAEICENIRVFFAGGNRNRIV